MNNPNYFIDDQQSDFNLESLFVKAGENPDKLRQIMNLFAQTKDNQVNTEEEWDQFLSIWGMGSYE